MLVKENVETISKLIDSLFNFVKADEGIQQDFIQYIENLPNKISSEAQLQAVLVPYVFERILENGKKIIDVYIDKNPPSDESEKKVLMGLNQTISSVFEITRLLKNGFELNNLVNEKSYEALTLVKMVNFRGITPGQYLIGRILPFEGEFYLIEINNILTSKSKEDAFRLAVIRQLENPEILYEDNSKKLHEIEQTVQNLGLKFVDYFKKDEIITTTEHVDALLGGFNDFVENNNTESIRTVDSLIQEPEKFAYFEVKEVTQGISDIAEAAAKGFSSHEKTYDVGIIYDLNLGLLILPFYGTFKKIFSVEDYKSVEGYKDCIVNYFTSDKIPPAPILRLYSENKDKFIKIVSEALGIEEKLEIQEILHKYKMSYYDRKRFSSPTILYSSKSFNELMKVAEDKQDIVQPADSRVGRNDMCPCGSGKKYKKCCLLNNL